MLLFALAVDRILRWMASAASPHTDRQFSCGVAGLRLNSRKCQIVIVGSLDLDLLRASVRALKGEYKLIR
eukprot:3944447-Pyramimonas_sp.AAC.1